ncbi:MAG: hypothetical protein ACJA1A_003151 [Saprospiraceae bacterium]|jgi:hypothetical protein
MKHILGGLFIIMQVGLYSQEQTVGLFTNEEASLNGYTLFTNSKTTHLLDNCGFEVQTWLSDFSPGLGVYLLENGNLLRCGRVSGEFNGGGVGGQFELLSWNGNTIWSYRFANEQMQSHHDVEPLPNGNFLTLAWTPLSGEDAVAAGRSFDADMWIEKIFEIKIIGTNEIEIVWEWSLADHLVQDQFPDKPNFGVISENPNKMDFNYIPADEGLDKDWAHFNAIAYNEQLDQIAISSRDFSEIWIIDHSTTAEEASTSSGGNSGIGGDILYRYGNPQVYDRGTADDQVLFKQHNIEWVDDDVPNGGSLSVFNNQWMTDRSRVERWTPPIDGFNYIISEGEAFGPSEPDWTYEESGFFSSRISGVQFLSNGNAFICSGGTGRFIEVTEDGDIVWEYINPMRSSLGPTTQGETIFQNAVFRILKYKPDHPAFEGKDLTPGNPIELEPFDSDCIITATEEFILEKDGLQVVQSLVSNTLEILAERTSNVQIINLNGVHMDDYQVNKGLSQIDISNYSIGMYFVVSNGKVIKFMKY